MPPWGAVKGFGNFAPDNGLTQEEILIISAWVVGGAPEGEPLTLPKTAVEPQLVIPALVDALKVSAKATLTKPLALYAIEPATAAVISSSRITARLPDGRIEPLVWLYQYDPKLNIRFASGSPCNCPPARLFKPLRRWIMCSKAHLTML